MSGASTSTSVANLRSRVLPRWLVVGAMTERQGDTKGIDRR